MIVTGRIAVRIAAIVVIAVILQLSFFSYLSILGATPYLVPVVVVALGLLGGGVVGAVCGFAAGLLVDSLLLQTLGVSSLVLLSIGYLAGRYREGFEIRNKLVPALLAGGFTLLGATGFAAIELMLGVDAPVSLLVVREILVQSLLAIGLGFVVYPLLRRVLAPALIDYAPSEPTPSVVGRLRRRRPRRSRAVEHSATPGRRRRRRTPIHGGVSMIGSRLARPADAEPVPASRRGPRRRRLVAFAVIFLRLWYLEVLSGDEYLAQAQNNQVREFTVQAPRGKVVDRHGEVLVDNRTALELQVKETDLPRSRERRAQLFERLGEVAGLRPDQIRNKIRLEAKECAACPATLRRDVAYDTVYFLRENQARFPGVSVERVYVRRYPQGSLAAHLLGYAGEVDSTQL